MVTAAGATVGAVEVERLGRQPRQPGVGVQRLQLLVLLGETGGGCDVDLDDPRVGGDRQRLQPAVRRRAVAFDDDGAAHRGRGSLDPGDQVDEILQRVGRRHEHVQQTIPDLRDDGGDRRRLGVLHNRLGRLRIDVEFTAGRQWISVEPLTRRAPTDGVQRQPEPGRGVSVEQHDPAAPQTPVGRGPPGVVVAPVQRQHPGGRPGHRLFDAGEQLGTPYGTVGFEIVGWVDGLARRLPHRRRQAQQGIVIGRPHLAGGQSESGGQRRQQLFGRGVRHLCGTAFPRCGQQRLVVPQRFAVAAPVQSDLPARQRFSRIPLALSVLHQTARRPFLLQQRGQYGGPVALVRPIGIGGPLRIHLVVDRDERRFAAHGQPDVAGRQPAVDVIPQRGDRRPGGLGVRQGDPRVLVHPGHGVGEVKAGLCRPGGTGDRGGRRRVRGGGQRDVAFSGEQPGGGVQSDPPRSGDVHLGPGVQVGEVRGRPRRTAVQGGHVGGQLHQVARDEPGGQTHLAQDRHQQPGRVAAGSDSGPQRVVGGLDTGFHPDAVTHRLIHGVVEFDQEVDGAHSGRERKVPDPLRQFVARSGAFRTLVDRPEVDLEIVAQIFRVAERKGLGEVLDEEVKRVDDLQVGDQPDRDRQLTGGVGENQPGHEVAERVLLPVDEVIGRFDIHRIGLDRSAAVRSRPQPHHMRMNLHQPIERVAGAMLQRHFDAHSDLSHHTPTLSAGQEKFLLRP